MCASRCYVSSCSECVNCYSQYPWAWIMLCIMSSYYRDTEFLENINTARSLETGSNMSTPQSYSSYQKRNICTRQSVKCALIFAKMGCERKLNLAEVPTTLKLNEEYYSMRKVAKTVNRSRKVIMNLL